MLEKVARSDQLEERLIEFAAKIIGMAGKLCNTFQGRILPGIRCLSLEFLEFLEFPVRSNISAAPSDEN